MEFFKITNFRVAGTEQQDQTGLHSSPAGNFHSAQKLVRNQVPYLEGHFFGTDYNFLYSEEMQREFAANCLNANYETLMHFENYNPGSQLDDLRMYINNGAQVNIDDEITSIVL